MLLKCGLSEKHTKFEKKSSSRFGRLLSKALCKFLCASQKVRTLNSINGKISRGLSIMARVRYLYLSLCLCYISFGKLFCHTFQLIMQNTLKMRLNNICIIVFHQDNLENV